MYFVLAAASLLSACGPKVVDFRNAEIVNGKIYKQGADSGFSGAVTNVPDGQLLRGQKGFTRLSQTLLAIFGPSHAMDRLLLSSSLCDVEVDDGVLDGEVTCSVAQSGMLRYRMAFKDGALHGPITLYDLTKDNNILATASFDDGVLDGKEELFSLKTQKLVHRIRWKEGLAVDEEESFDPNTGEKTGSYAYRNGELHGETIRYAADGKRVIYRATRAEGLKNGVEEEFHPETGAPLRYVEWTQGKKNGTFKEWDPEGNLKVDAIYENDLDVTPRPAVVPASAPAPASAADYATCLELWTAAFRKEYGKGEAIPRDQWTEWQRWFDAGKRPS